MTREYPEIDPDDEDPFQWIRELEDHELEDHVEYLSLTYAHMLGELAFRADRPEKRDGTGEISVLDTQFYSLRDEIIGTISRRIERDDPSDN